MAGQKLFLADMMVLSVVLVLASRSLIVTVAQDDPYNSELDHRCSPATYVNKSDFEDNLVEAFASLVLNISSKASHFATSVSNKSVTDEVYALFSCREYLKGAECQECLMVAQKSIQERCSNEGSNGGRIYLDGCFLRYENETFFEQGTDGLFLKYCPSVSDTKPQEFNETAKRLLSQLTADASRSHGYAVGNISNASTPVYGLAQCVPTLSVETCEECLKEAHIVVANNCLPKQQGCGMQAGCIMRYANFPFYNNSFSSSNNTDFPTTSSKSNFKAWPILLGSIGGAALLAALCSVFIYRRSFQRFNHICFRGRHPCTKTEEDLGTSEIFEGAVLTFSDLGTAETFEQVIFPYSVLRDATVNFDKANLVGKGGFGEVYKGILVDGTEIAVKVSESRSSKATEDFLTEVKLISSVRHRNLVRLLGCCARGHERLLVYEYMSNSSLDKHLFGDTGNHLDWETRFNIIVGTARGLAYLHEDSNIRIVHRDIKAANILLDDKFHPKIADFGLARFFPEGETHLCTRVGGTIGYTAPEYALHGQLSEKADVYSYGVLVLEIISGRKCLNPNPLQPLLEWAWKQYENDQALEIVDVKIRERGYPREQVLRVINIGLLCCQALPDVRPTMSEAVSMLTRSSEMDVRPTQPTLINGGITSWRPSLSATASTSASDGAQSHGPISVSSLAR